MKFPVQDAIVRPPIWDHIRPDVAALGADDAVGKRLDGGVIWQMADVHDRAMIATARIAIG
jgi:hypothetical protein